MRELINILTEASDMELVQTPDQQPVQPVQQIQQVQKTIQKPIQRPVVQPTPVAPTQPSSESLTFINNLAYLKLVKNNLPADMQLLISKLSSVVDGMIRAVLPLSEGELDSVGITAGALMLDKVRMLYAQATHTNDWAKFKEIMADVANVTKEAKSIQQSVIKDPTFKKAATAAIKSIQLDTRGQFVIKDTEIKQLADNFAKRFGLKPIWARNLIGMFDISVKHEDRVKFLKACESGEALDISAMIKQGHGSIEDVVTTKVPGLREVFKSLKETLLDITLSTGQRGATGPFEALVAIMGGGRKPTTQEGGDIVVKNTVNGVTKDVKLELKAGSITVKASTGKVGGLSGAWLDSTAGGEMSPSYLRKVANDWLANNFPLAFKNPQLAELWKGSDFRPGQAKKGNPAPILAKFKEFLTLSDKKKPGLSDALIGSMMATMFPSITNIKGYDFSAAVTNIVDGIKELDNKKIAKEQGIMALLEYIAGKGNDGFLLFNSSTQEYKIIMGLKGVLNLYKSNSLDVEKSLVRFNDTMTMLGSSTKCSPGIYFGPDNTSNRAKEYAEKYMSDPGRVKLRAAAEAAGDPEFDPENPVSTPAPEPDPNVSPNVVVGREPVRRPVAPTAGTDRQRR